jgi:hypothetical protein
MADDEPNGGQPFQSVSLLMAVVSSATADWYGIHINQ